MGVSICLKYFDCFLERRKMGKPRGLKTARKIRTHRRVQRWADKDYKKAFRNSPEGKSFRRRFSRERHRSGEDWSRGETAQFRYQKVRQSPAHQKRQKDHGIRAQGRLFELHRGK